MRIGLKASRNLLNQMIKIYYIRYMSIIDGINIEGIIKHKGKIKEFASEKSCQLWLNKNRNELSDSIYTPVVGFKKPIE